MQRNKRDETALGYSASGHQSQPAQCQQYKRRERKIVCVITLLIWLMGALVFVIIDAPGGLDTQSTASPSTTGAPNVNAETMSSRTNETPTIGQRNALAAAMSYLSFSAFSRQGLIAQLEYEQYSHEDAVYAVDHCGADWYEQAVKKAQSYLEFSSFSRQGLIDQLVFEGFTTEQAIYGVTGVGY